MKNQEVEKSLKGLPNQVTNNSYIELLEKYILFDKTNDLENKHKQWCKDISAQKNKKARKSELINGGGGEI